MNQNHEAAKDGLKYQHDVSGNTGTGNSMKLETLLFAVVLAASAAQAQAQTPMPSGDTPTPADRKAAHAAVMKACGADIQSLCADKTGREMMRCLRVNTDKLSAGCRDALPAPMHRPATPPPSH